MNKIRLLLLAILSVGLSSCSMFQAAPASEGFQQAQRAFAVRMFGEVEK